MSAEEREREQNWFSELSVNRYPVPGYPKNPHDSNDCRVYWEYLEFEIETL